jgi:hypothetical protein
MKQQSRGKHQWLDVVKLTGAEAFMERWDSPASCNILKLATF